MTRPSKPCDNHASEVMRLARDGVSFSAISDRCGGTIDRCRWVWSVSATIDDERTRHLAKARARIVAKRPSQPARAGPAAPDGETFAPGAFGNNVDPIEYGKATPPDDARRSSTGCAALMACS